MSRSRVGDPMARGFGLEPSPSASPRTSMIAEIISIGSELVSGQGLDTNSQWLSRALGGVGISVHFHTTLGDDLDENVAAFRVAISRADLVLMTGGLGPTQDDLTRDALALA